MIKSELIQKIAAANQHLYHRDIERIVNVVFNEIVEALARGDRVELRGFGAFTVKHRAPRVGRNPRTGAAVSVAEKFVPFFKTGKDLRERLNARSGSRQSAVGSRRRLLLSAALPIAYCLGVASAAAGVEIRPGGAGRDRPAHACRHQPAWRAPGARPVPARRAGPFAGAALLRLSHRHAA